MSATSLKSLRAALPTQYRLWVRVALGILVFGYAATTVARFVKDGPAAGLRATELWTLLVAIAAVGLEWRGRTTAAAITAAGVAWLEINLTFLVSPLGVRVSSGVALPIILMATGLLFGARLTIVATVVSSVWIPVALMLSRWMGIGPGITARDSMYLIVLEVCLYGTAAVLLLYLRTFEQVLSRSQRNARRAAELIDDAPDAIVAASPNGLIEAFNREAERLLGVGRESVLGMPLAALPLRRLDAEDAAGPALEMADGSREVVVADGPTTLEALSRSRTREDGTQGQLFVLRDVTQRRDSEQRSRELEHQLQHRQKLEALGQLAGGIAHDFNNLLTAVGGYASMADDTDDPDLQEMCEQLQVAQQRGAALTRQLLAFARQEVVSPKPVRLDEIIEGLGKLIQRVVGERITLDPDPDEACTIHIDPGQLEQIIINLAANARDAMPNGGTLYVGCRLADDGTRAELEIRDTGIGMDVETQRRMFDPFYTTKPRGRGTGLGLSTVHGIVAQSGGQISAESALGQGTSLRITWPVCEAQVDSQLDPRRRAAPIRRRGRILLVEDDDAVRGFVRRVLRKAGFEVFVAANGSEAVTLASSLSRAPDLLLTDVVMPGLTGPQLIERLQRLAPGVPVLYMSGYLDDVLEDFTFDPVEDLIVKPFTVQGLLQRVDSKLSGRPWRSPGSGTLAAIREPRASSDGAA